MTFFPSERRPLPRTVVYQLRAVFAEESEHSETLDRFCDFVLQYAARSVYMRKPTVEEAKAGFLVENKERNSRCECVSIPERCLWAIRFNFPSKERDFNWYYDISATASGGDLLLGLKIEASAGTDAKTLQKQQTFLDEMLSLFNLRCPVPLKENLIRVIEAYQVADLIEILKDRNRTLPVIVVSAVNWKAWDLSAEPPDYLVDVDYLASRVQGYAFIVQLGYHAAYELTKQIGREWAVYDGAVRVYAPQLDLEHGNPSAHRVRYKDAIYYWKHDDQTGPEVYTAFLIESSHYWLPRMRINWEGLYFLPAARGLASELELARTINEANAPEREQNLCRRVEALEQQLANKDEEMNEWLRELDAARETAEFYDRQNISLRNQLESYRAYFAKHQEAAPPEEVSLPDNYRELPGWVQKHLAGRLLLLPRAERALSKAEYEDVEMVCRALQILANEYRNSRLGTGSDQEFRDALLKYRMSFSGSIDECRAGEEGDAYFVNYPVGSQQKEFLEYHLERATSREPRYCLRIYFFWDAVTGQVVVGWLPSHLGNRIS